MSAIQIDTKNFKRLRLDELAEIHVRACDDKAAMLAVATESYGKRRFGNSGWKAAKQIAKTKVEQLTC